METNRYSFSNASYLAISGGVGGAKLALGLSQLLDEKLSIVANTGDDFNHFGLKVCPDLDTLMYTLANINDKKRGWGLENETWNFLEAMKALGQESWFQLGDRDLATHITRTNLLDRGMSLSEVTTKLGKQLEIKSLIFPMSDQDVTTKVCLKKGEWIPFQDYFVKQQCKPEVEAFRFDGISQSKPSPALEACLDDPSLKGIFICPSNPFVSIDPILSIPGLIKRLKEHSAPVIAVSPIIGGQAIKGPTAKIMKEFNIPQSALSVAKHYGSLLDGYIIDNEDAHLKDQCLSLGVKVHATNTMMKTLADKISLASECLTFSKEVIGASK
ncbi:MAG: 2-phospho-L-lactate transferase [Gammaproteobacteria bacterium]|nr:2-phospho-L-lactate transferase [Gammaproteobacteria bacterium]